MIVPSIDIVDGKAVQLVGGEQQAPRRSHAQPLARHFDEAELGEPSRCIIVDQPIDPEPLR